MPIILVMMGIALVLLALFILLAVVFHLPDTWPGGLLALTLLALGVGLVRAGVLRNRQDGPSSR